MLKMSVKNYIGRAFSKLEYPLVVNSYGRSGSTVLTKSIINCAISERNNFLRDIALKSISQSAWDLDEINLKNGIIYKSHDYPPSNHSNGHIKMIYTFADPLDVILSLIRLFNERGEDWIKLHYEHLGASYTNNFGNIINEDQLNLEVHLEKWLNETRFPIAFIRYENMWENQDKISKYLGFEIQLPVYKKRKSKNIENERVINKIRETYLALRSKLEKLDDFFIHNPHVD